MNWSMSVSQITDLVGTTTSNTYTYLAGVLPYLLVFGAVIGVLFFAIRWVRGVLSGHGHRV